MLDVEGRIAQVEHFLLKTGYQLRQRIEGETNPLLARVEALAIPLLCFCAEVAKTAADVHRLALMGYRFIAVRKLENGNVQTGAVHVGEHIRNLAGVVSGLFLGMYQPQKASQLFLTGQAQTLQVKHQPEAAALLYAVGHGVKTFFEAHGIDYRICSGSILGAIRCEGIIPWDDDIDLMIAPWDEDKVRALIEDGTFAKETGLEVSWQPFTSGWQAFHPSSPKGEGLLKGIGYPFLDIFCTKLDVEGDTNLIVFKSEEQRRLSTAEYITVDEWCDAKEYPFGPTSMRGVLDPLPYIARCYGRDSLNFAYQTAHHDVLSQMHQNPLDFKGHYEKICSYGLPRRAYLVDRSSMAFDRKVYETAIQTLKIEGAESEGE